ncbi:ribonuclease P [Candidatus Termititenax persephonae]|uniref:Ribonuclease P protein component n=1 Tax=Candidatus Termititenax persephonae TaxID=2218525 RepID=A0A388TK30_9BACT|nr:ribonuclease P [Candidatus Termititenax persephonae]
MFGTLTRQADFAAVYAQGRKRVGKSFVLFYLPHAESRYAVVASKKAIGNAVRRNRAKRLLRELLRAVGGAGQGIWAGHLLLVARAGILQNDFTETRGELERCLKKLLSV